MSEYVPLLKYTKDQKMSIFVSKSMRKIFCSLIMVNHHAYSTGSVRKYLFTFSHFCVRTRKGRHMSKLKIHGLK